MSVEVLLVIDLVGLVEWNCVCYCLVGLGLSILVMLLLLVLSMLRVLDSRRLVFLLLVDVKFVIRCVLSVCVLVLYVLRM